MVIKVEDMVEVEWVVSTESSRIHRNVYSDWEIKSLKMLIDAWQQNPFSSQGHLILLELNSCSFLSSALKGYCRAARPRRSL